MSIEQRYCFVGLKCSMGCVPWTLNSLTKLGFTAVDAFVTQYYMKLVCTDFFIMDVLMCTAYKNLANTFLISFPSNLSSMLEA